MNLKKSIVLVLFLVLHAGSAKSEVIAPLVSVFADSLTGASLKVGAAYQMDGSFPYTNIEYGTKAKKVAIGYAIESDTAMLTRFGLSYLQTDIASFYGLESTVTLWVFALRVGVYQNTSTDNQHLSLGIGFGF